MELMSDPVMVATGHTYDRQCIAKWLAQGNRTCPVTGMRLRHLELVPNHALRNAIQVGCPLNARHATEKAADDYVVLFVLWLMNAMQARPG
jgi:F-box/WD-40 domain protein 7